MYVCITHMWQEADKFLLPSLFSFYVSLSVCLSFGLCFCMRVTILVKFGLLVFHWQVFSWIYTKCASKLHVLTLGTQHVALRLFAVKNIVALCTRYIQFSFEIICSTTATTTHTSILIFTRDEQWQKAAAQRTEHNVKWDENHLCV